MSADELPHQARRVDPEKAKVANADPWERARQEDAVIDGDEGDLAVRLGDGDVHDVRVLEDREGYVAACDCDGWSFHGEERLAGGACAHVLAVVREAALDESIVADVDGEVMLEGVDADVVEHDQDGADQDDVDAALDDDRAEADVATADSEVEPRGERADHAAPPAPAEGDLPAADLDNPFAGALEDVDDRFVMTLGGDPYIRREGWQRLAHAEGYRIRSDMVTFQGETESTLAEARAEVLDEDGDVLATGTGTAHIDAEDLSGAVGNLNELAETRAISRAMGWATGAGLSAVEVDASAEYDGDRARADGGRR